MSGGGFSSAVRMCWVAMVGWGAERGMAACAALAAERSVPAEAWGDA